MLIIEYMRELRYLASIPLSDFKADARNAAAAESFLRRSLEAAFDVGRHILARTGSVDLASEHKSIARALGDKDIVDTTLAESLVQMAGYRNRLVHLYHQIAEDELYEIIREDLDDLSLFVESIQAYVETLED